MLVLGGAAREDLARFCLEPDTAEAKRALAWVNAICLAYLVIGLLGLRPPPIYVVKHPLPEEAVPTVIEPLISAVQQIAPDSATEEAPKCMKLGWGRNSATSCRENFSPFATLSCDVTSFVDC